MIKKIIVITAFAIAMGFLETSIVVYLRELFYPEGFAFPLKSMKNYLILTELLRETATIIMLITIAWLVGNSRHTRFAWFIYMFAIWDIFYYVFLKIILNWPVSWFTWDVLFLIPCLWVSPVLAPVLLCLLMIIIWAVIMHFDRLKYLTIKKWDYALLIFASLILIVNFCWDNLIYMINAPNDQLHVLHLSYIPHYFNWWVFAFACVLILITIINIWQHNTKRLSTVRQNQIL